MNMTFDELDGKLQSAIARAQKAEWELGQWKLAFPTAREANEVAGWLQQKRIKIKALEAELERVKTQNAVLTEAVKVMADSCGNWTRVELERIGKEALAGNADKECFTRDQVMPLVSCLEHIKMLATECREESRIVLSAAGLSACSGIAHAKDIGLLKDTP
jgi:hypothetical protein